MRGDRHGRGSGDAGRQYVDVGGVGSGGDGIGAGLVSPALPLRAQVTPGGIRPSLAELHEAAAMERAREPKSARRAILDLGLATGQPFSDVATLTIGDMEYVLKSLRDRHGHR